MQMLSTRQGHAPSGLGFTITGAGRPLVLVHGLMARGSMFEPLVPLLERDFRLIAVDAHPRVTFGGFNGFRSCAIIPPMTAQSRPQLTYAEYLEQEATATEKHDFINGETYAMAGGKLEHAPTDAHALANPVVLIEVLSEGTEAYDRGAKAFHYRRLPSLREYVLVSQADRRIEVQRLNERGIWELHFSGPGERAELTSLGISISVDAVYANPIA